jgi:hypothetical protein
MTSLDAACVEATVMSELCEESARSNGMVPTVTQDVEEKNIFYIISL